MTEKSEEKKGNVPIGILLLENKEAKEVYCYLVEADKDKKTVISSLGVPAKFLFQYLTENQDKFMDKSKAKDGMMVA
jgi:hypothetical protein